MALWSRTSSCPGPTKGVGRITEEKLPTAKWRRFRDIRCQHSKMGLRFMNAEPFSLCPYNLVYQGFPEELMAEPNFIPLAGKCMAEALVMLTRGSLVF